MGPVNGVIEKKHKPIMSRVNPDTSAGTLRMERYSETTKN